jgi:hypothetical protein
MEGYSKKNVVSATKAWRDSTMPSGEDEVGEIRKRTWEHLVCH